jgi:hypothetical protein
VLYAGKILGTEVGSTAPGFLAVLAVHVLCALVAVFSGAAAALTRKGGVRHVRFGRWYFRSIGLVFATALALTAMRPRQDYPLAIVGAVAFSAATVGYLHRRRHRPGDAPHIVGVGLSYVAILTAFYVDNGPHLPLWNHLPTIAFWFLPGLIGTPIVIRAMRRAPARSHAPSPAGGLFRR